jgi:hypothetical protein
MTVFETLTEMRRAGMRPDRPVNVAFTDPAASGLTLFMRDVTRRPFDWRVLVGLDVIVWADTKTAFAEVSRTVVDIARARPAELQLCFLHGEEWHLIDCGSGRFQPDVQDVPGHHEFQWQPINLGSSAMGYRLKAALHKTIKPGAYL